MTPESLVIAKVGERGWLSITASYPQKSWLVGRCHSTFAPSRRSIHPSRRLCPPTQDRLDAMEGVAYPIDIVEGRYVFANAEERHRAIDGLKAGVFSFD